MIQLAGACLEGLARLSRPAVGSRTYRPFVDRKELDIVPDEQPSSRSPKALKPLCQVVTVWL